MFHMMSSVNTACKSISKLKTKSTSMIAAQNKPKEVDTQTFLQHAPPTLEVFGNKPPNTRPPAPHDNDPTPWQPSHGGSNQEVFGFLFFDSLPRRLFSNLRTACSETLMLRERKASMAERSLSSLTGELLLLATTAAAFATFAARRLGGDEYHGEGRGEMGPGWSYSVGGS